MKRLNEIQFVHSLMRSKKSEIRNRVSPNMLFSILYSPYTRKPSHLSSWIYIYATRKYNSEKCNFLYGIYAVHHYYKCNGNGPQANTLVCISLVIYYVKFNFIVNPSNQLTSQFIFTVLDNTDFTTISLEAVSKYDMLSSLIVTYKYEGVLPKNI